MTKEALTIYNNYNNSNKRTLNDVYTTYSSAKARALRECEKDMFEHNGSHLRILTANTFQFTCAYIYDEIENGYVYRHLVYFTASKRKDFIVNRFETL